MITTRPKILCVDDEPEILNFFEAVLVPSGCEVIRAEDGEEALEKIKTLNIDLVISDIRMPKLDGFEVCGRIKENEKYRNIPVILITGLTAKEDRIKGIEAGAEDFLSKPIDPAEVLARIKMLLKVKALNERRIGELLIEMKFITEDQLRKALIISKEQNIKVGEALYAMGALDKDHIYWALSNQLKMNYIELSFDMIDPELIKQFPIDLLDELLCLPLYEAIEEIHFAIADPTDPKIVDRVKNIRPEKTVQLHLALPEKIRDILNFFRKESSSKVITRRRIQLEERSTSSPYAKTVTSHPLSKREQVWQQFLSLLFMISPGETYWFYKISHDCRLFSQRKERSELLHEYPEEIYSSIKERLKQAITYSANGQGTTILLKDKYTQRQGAFKLWQINGLGNEIVQIERIPIFSEEELTKSHPQAHGLINDLQHLFNEHQRLIIGGEDKLLIKQCCYSVFKGSGLLINFPPPFLIECETEICFPKVVQLPRYQFNINHFLNHLKGGLTPPLFYESELPEWSFEERYFGKIFSGRFKNIILFLPLSSIEMMKKAISVHQDWRKAGFQAIFATLYQWKPI